MDKRELVSNSVWVLLNHVIYRGSLFVAFVLLARSFSASQFAAYAYFQLTITMLATYAALGLGVTASRYFAEVQNSRSSKVAPPVGLIWLASLVLGLIAALVILFIPDDWLSAGLAVPGWILALGVFSLSLNTVPEGGILGCEKYREATVISFFGGLILLVAAFYATTTGSIDFAMAGVMFSMLLKAFGQSVVILRTCGLQKIFGNLSFKYEDFRTVFGFAGPMFLVSVLSASGVWLIGRIIVSETDELQFSVFSIGMQWYSLAMLVPGVISRVVLPRLVRYSTTTGVDHMLDSSRLVRKAGLLSLLFSIAMVLVVILVSPWLVSLYGEKYESYRWLLVLFCVAAMFSAPVNSFGNALVANDGQRLWLLFTLLSTTVLVASGIATRSFGAWSGAVSLVFSALILCILSVSALRIRKLL